MQTFFTAEMSNVPALKCPHFKVRTLNCRLVTLSLFGIWLAPIGLFIRDAQVAAEVHSNLLESFPRGVEDKSQQL